jgi:hypothetical protein
MIFTLQRLKIDKNRFKRIADNAKILFLQINEIFNEFYE